MAACSFRCYVAPDGTDEIRATYDGKGKQARTKLVSRLRTLARLPFDEWTSQWHKDLKGKASGISEIRFFADNVQQRVLGYRSGENEYTILFWATEKGGKFVPLSAPATALSRKKHTIESRDRSCELWLALE